MMSRPWFRNLFLTSTDPYHHYLLPGNKFPRLSETDLLPLEQPVTGDEIKKAQFDIEAHKAPDPNGFHALFYQHLWETTGNNLIHLALSILSGHDFPEMFNDTFLVLIPKV